MEKLISCCGLNCATCDARVATIENNEGLRKATADKWKVMFNVPEMSPDMINCTGCREEGVKFNHCEVCEIRSCVNEKGFETCGDCSEMTTCIKVSAVHKYVPEAILNLKSLN